MDFSCKEKYSKGDGLGGGSGIKWGEILEDLRRYYSGEVRVEAQVEWCLEKKYGGDWNVDRESGSYAWEKREGVAKSCRERSAKQLLRENRLDE